MSADNGIYILKTIDSNTKNDGKLESYRVAYASAIDNFYYFEELNIQKLYEYMVDIWKNSPIFYCKTDALIYADNLSKSFPYLEYGIQTIETKYDFYAALHSLNS